MLVVVPLTTKFPLTVKSFDIVTSAGSPYVIVPELSATFTSFDVPAKVKVPPSATGLVFEPSETVMLEFESFAFAIEPDNIALSTEPEKGVIYKGKGCWLWDKTGKKYLDAVAGIATCSLGHSDRVLRRRLSTQLNKIQHISNLYNIEEQEELSRTN